MKIIAHRCGTDKYEEQTIQAARHSALLGADLLEVDIRYTADGFPVVIHDATPEKLYGVSTPVREMTLVQFLALRRIADCSVCGHAFKDYLECGIKDMLFHIKEGGEHLYEIAAMCREYGILDRVAFGVQSVEDVKIVKSISPDIKVLAFMPKSDTTKEYAAAGADYIRLWEQWLSDESIAEVKETGKKLWIMSNAPTVGEVVPGSYEYYESTGADGILVNVVEPAVKYFKK